MPKKLQVLTFCLSFQTGSGKTYTMGTSFDLNNTLGPEQVGIIPRAMSQLFEGIRKRKQDAIDQNRAPPEFKVQCQFIEVTSFSIIKTLFLGGILTHTAT